MNPVILITSLLFSCYSTDISKSYTHTEIDLAFNDYWYNNEAEISSYNLSQARYGEIHEGHAVLIYVTEQFSPSSGAKANNPTQKDPPVMKLNFTKKFNTGIYPYSMMTSIFFPISGKTHSLKISSSSQEWCGHTYMEMFNKKQFELQIASYFEGESRTLKLKKNLLEDDLWIKIRLNPKNLPTGRHQVIPSFFSLRLMHKALKDYSCDLSLDTENDNYTYNIEYPELERSVSIIFEKEFPYRILGWEETKFSGFGENRKILTTKATLIKTIKSPYWQKHSNEDSHLRKELGLE